MAEKVFHKVQIAAQAGTFAAPGASVAATDILPVTEAVVMEMDRASQFPNEDYGRNIKNHAGRGYHGVRAVTFPLNGEVTFEQLHKLLEMHFAGGVVASGGGPYTRVYTLEAGAPTLIPYTVESGTETSQDQYEAVGTLIDELTLGFDDLDVPGAHPWTFQANCMALNKVTATVTGALSSTAVETPQGHLTIIKEGAIGTAFASLAELTASLVSFQIVTRRSLELRVYGGTTDVASGYGFAEKTTGEVTAKIKIAATSATDIHDAWNSSGAVLGEKRWRVSAVGSGTKVMHVDFRFGMLAVPVGERGGERVYEVSGEIVDDSTLSGAAQITTINGIA